MNLVLLFMLSISSPLIYGKHFIVPFEINSKPTEFELIVGNCYMKLEPLDPDVFTCSTENHCKIGTHDLACCIRVVQYKCMKIWLITKCNVTKENVEKNDEEHFNLWRNMFLGFKGNCTGNSTESLEHCNLNDEASSGTSSTPKTSSTTTVPISSSTTPSGTTQAPISEDEFLIELEKCTNKIGLNNSDYNGCLNDETLKMGWNNTEDKSSCCIRVVNYICMKESLTSECGVSQENVQKYDEIHFNYWNEKLPEITGECNGAVQESIEYCNVVSKITWNLTLLLASFLLSSIFILCIFMFLAKFKLLVNPMYSLDNKKEVY